jgi:hypothetical protein
MGSQAARRLRPRNNHDQKIRPRHSTKTAMPLGDPSEDLSA